MKAQIAATAVVFGSGLASAYAQITLPVYSATERGLNATQISEVVKQFKLPKLASLKGSGELNYVDTYHYLRLPFAEGPRNDDTEEMLNDTVNKFPSLPIQLQAVDTSELATWATLSEKTALEEADNGFRAAGSLPQFGTPMVTHNYFELLRQSATGGWTSTDTPIDTSVVYSFTDPSGHRIIGPGAQVQVTFNGDGSVSRMAYGAYQLKQIGTVSVISSSEAESRILATQPKGSTTSVALVYWTPPLRQVLPGTFASNPTILPFYIYTVTPPSTVGAVSPPTARTRVHLLPATDDSAYIPRATITASVAGSDVKATVNISGGRAPYTVIWGTGGNGVTANFGHWVTNVKGTATMVYEVQRRWLGDFSQYGLSLRRDETISATIIDANGVQIEVSKTVLVTASAVTPGSLVPTPESGNALLPSVLSPGTPLNGIESPADPGEWTACRVGWQSSTFAPGSGAGTQKFCWMGDDAWPGDFVEPSPKGTAVSQPWLNGDADYSNWGVNTADLVLHIGDGNADGFTQMQPGAPLADYATAFVGPPYYSPDIWLNGNGYGSPVSDYRNFSRSWGTNGPNDTLEWLLMDDCDTHDFNDGNTVNIAQRWGPLFEGLHVWCGFASLENGDGPFERDAAANLLGLNGPAQTIVQSWFNSAFSNSTGDPAAMGPAIVISIFAFSDFSDYYWGKGRVNATILPSEFTGTPLLQWWYIHGHNPTVLVP